MIILYLVKLVSLHFKWRIPDSYDPYIIRNSLLKTTQVGENFFYEEQLPCIHLQPYIHCFWELKTTEPLVTSYNYRLITDGCIDLIIDCQSFNGMLIAGIADAAFEVPMDGSISYFG